MLQNFTRKIFRALARLVIVLSALFAGAATAAAQGVDVRALYEMGVHSLLLRPFSLLHRVSNEDYAKALKGLE